TSSARRSSTAPSSTCTRRTVTRAASAPRAATCSCSGDGAKRSPVLELHDPEGAFEALEAYLADEGFWGRDGVVADLYLGYGLSAPLRRSDTALPPEPCPLPLLACCIRPGRELDLVTKCYKLGEW